MKKLVHAYEALTDSEKRVCNYIVNQADSVLQLSAQEVAVQTNTSKTVVINTTKKLGFDGFTDLKYYLKERTQASSNVMSSTSFSSNVIELTKMTGNLINYKNLERAASEILEARTVYIAARGTSKAVAQHLAHLLLTEGVKCILLNDYNLLSIISETLDMRELLITISLSGETVKIVDAVKTAKSRNAHVVSITSFTNNTVARLSDVNLYTASQSVETASDDGISRIGMFMLVEMIVNEVKKQVLIRP